MQTSDAMRREIAKLYPPSLRAKRSNPSHREKKDGLLRFARNDGLNSGAKTKRRGMTPPSSDQ
ncbi:hypothetical protein V1294_005167 [Bradyrhizobium sp. AZCC 1678]